MRAEADVPVNIPPKSWVFKPEGKSTPSKVVVRVASVTQDSMGENKRNDVLRGHVDAGIEINRDVRAHSHPG